MENTDTRKAQAVADFFWNAMFRKLVGIASENGLLDKAVKVSNVYNGEAGEIDMIWIHSNAIQFHCKKFDWTPCECFSDEVMRDVFGEVYFAYCIKD